MMPFRCKSCGKEFASKRKGIPTECEDPTRFPQGCPIERVPIAADSDVTLPPDTAAAVPNDNGSLLLKHLPKTARAFLRWDGAEEELRSGSVIGRNGVGSDKLREDVSVSREHAKIETRNGSWCLRNISRSQSPLSLDGVVVLPEQETTVSSGIHEIAIGASGLRLTLEVR